MYSSRDKGFTSVKGLNCKRLVKNGIEDITWTLENNVVKKSRKLCLVKTCIIQIILLLRCLNKEWCA